MNYCPGLRSCDLSQSDNIRLWSYVEIKEDADLCWPWMGAPDKDGYGRIRIKGGRKVTAHKAAFASKKGDVPVNKLVCHSCDNPPCCNPNHLWLGTPKDNAIDMANKGRSLAGDRHPTRIHPETLKKGINHWSYVKPGLIVKGEKSGMSKLTNEHVRIIRDSNIAARILASKFNVHYKTVQRVRNKTAWKHLP